MANDDYSDVLLLMKPLCKDALHALHSSNQAEKVHRVSHPPPDAEFRLLFKPPPKDMQRGFVFGCDVKDCDVALQNLGDYRVSRQHFRIEFVWQSGFLRLHNMSRNGTGIGARSLQGGRKLLRQDEGYIINPDEQIKLFVGTLQLEISCPPREYNAERFRRNMEDFRDRYCKALPNLDHLVVQSVPQVTPSFEARTGTYGEYFLHGGVGKGGQGTVRKATDYRTAKMFAAKQSHSPKHQLDAEIALLKKVSHDHIVSFVDSTLDSNVVILIMEYVDLGNLAQQAELRPISFSEIHLVLRQASEALAYLHDEMHITHRDIKPENILVKSRAPEIFIKLCDFGISTEKDRLRTCCGTMYYAAAEVFTGSYTNAVDIWAIGVVGLEFTLGLPSFVRKPRKWCESLRRHIDHAADFPLRVPIQRMLELEPQRRPTARRLLHTLENLKGESVDLMGESDPKAYVDKPTVSEQTTVIRDSKRSSANVHDPPLLPSANGIPQQHAIPFNPTTRDLSLTNSSGNPRNRVHRITKPNCLMSQSWKFKRSPYVVLSESLALAEQVIPAKAALSPKKKTPRRGNFGKKALLLKRL
ncbi:MAG: hypothetical protein Q9217_003675 [Psora testacea]